MSRNPGLRRPVSLASAALAALLLLAPRPAPAPADVAAFGPARDLVLPAERFHRAELVAAHTRADPPRASRARAAQPLPRAATATTVRPRPSARNAATEACIVRRENGGSYARGSNPTHFGRYQFSRSTWAANGGNPATWGSASPQEQDAVFARTVQRNGYRDWTPYNGC